MPRVKQAIATTKTTLIATCEKHPGKPAPPHCPACHGAAGHAAMVAKHPESQRRRWAKRGGYPAQKRAIDEAAFNDDLLDSDAKK